MRKSLRTIAAVCILASTMLSQTITTHATENYGPGFQNGIPIEQTEQQETTAPKQQETTPTPEQTGESQPAGEQTGESQPAVEQTPEEKAAADQAAAEAEAERAAAEAAAQNLPRLQTTVMTLDGVWSRPFVNDEQITLNEEGTAGFQSISIYLTNTVGNVLYRVFTSEHGWTPWVMNGQQTTVYLDGSPVEMVQMRLTGHVNNTFDLYYTSNLNDGTANDWAKDGQSTGTMGRDKMITNFRMALNGEGLEWPYATTKLTDSEGQDGIQVVDGQLRAFNGDGSVHNGWAWLGNDRYYFQDSVPVTGWQYIDGYKFYFDESGKNLKDVEPVLGKAGPYEIRINKEMNTTTIYAKDGANGYIIPVKSFLSSTGDDTPVGTFKTPEKYRWRLMINDCYTQYATRLYAGGSFLMHSVIYDRPNNMTLRPETFNYMGIARSAGCIRYTSADAKWIYDNCGLGTSVTVYNSAVPGPFDRPAIEHMIPMTQTWDPTDVTVGQ